MARKNLYGWILIVGLINMLLLILIVTPHLQKLQTQIEQEGALEVGVMTPLHYDYFYDYVLAKSEIEGEWQVDTYKEVQRLVDETGQVMRDVETGRLEYMRYFLGDEDAMLYDLLLEEE